MAPAALDRDYATAWPLIESVLEEACRERHRAAARRRFFQHAQVAMLLRKLGRYERQRARRHLQEAAASLRALDAFAIARRIRESHGLSQILYLQDTMQLTGPILRLVRWVETWNLCRTPRSRGEQGLITLLLVRDDRLIAVRIAEHLQQQAAIAESENRVDDAYRLRLGTVLCKRDPTPQDVSKIEAPLAKKNREAMAKQRPLGSSIVRASPHAKAYVVHLNHLACCASKKTYIRREYRSRASLERFIRTRTQFLKAGETPASPPVVPYHVGLDLVGAAVGDCAPAVCSCQRKQPRKITRGLGKKQSYEWPADLRSFLGRDLIENPTTLEELVRRHMPRVEPELWLFAGPKVKGMEVPNLAEDTRRRLASSHEPTVELLIAVLETALAKARRLREYAKYGSYRKLQNWCRSVNRNVMAAERPSVVKAPWQQNADVHSPLWFNPDYNYALIDFCRSQAE